MYSVQKVLHRLSTQHTGTLLSISNAIITILGKVLAKQAMEPPSLLEDVVPKVSRAMRSQRTLPKAMNVQSSWRDITEEQFCKTWASDSLHSQFILIGLFCSLEVPWIDMNAALVREQQYESLTRNTGIIYCIITPLN